LSPVIFELWKDAFSLLLTGAAIKTMDDSLDAPSAPSACLTEQPGALAYALLFLAGGAGLNAALAISLFFAAYAIGMAYDLTEKMPSGLYGYQESLLVAGVGAALFGWAEMLGSLLVIACIQLLDDLRDQTEDRLSGQKNLARRYGQVEIALLGTILLLAAARLALVKAVLTILASLVITALVDHYGRRGEERRLDYDL